MSYFDNINFEESSLLEGQQAREYEARKLEERNSKDDKQLKRDIGRYSTASDERVGDKYRDLDFFNSEDKKRRDKAKSIVNKEYKKREKEDDDTLKKYVKSLDDLRNGTGSRDTVNRIKQEYDKKNSNYLNIRSDRDISKAKDATNRHIRRHPNQYKEAVELAESLLESYNPDCIFC